MKPRLYLYHLKCFGAHVDVAAYTVKEAIKKARERDRMFDWKYTHGQDRLQWTAEALGND